MRVRDVIGKIKVGDWVRVNTINREFKRGTFEGVVGEISRDGFYVWHNDPRFNGGMGNIPPSSRGFRYSWFVSLDDDDDEEEEERKTDLEIIKGLKGSKLTIKYTIMNLIEKFSLVFTPEPKKSFKKVGIVDGDNVITQEGMKIFLTWLLDKYGDEFKKEVVDKILKEQSEIES